MSPVRLLVPRPEGQSEVLVARLREIGIDAVEVPAVAIAPPESYDDLDHAIAGLDRFDWILLTSRNGAAVLFERLAVVAAGRPLPRLRWAAIGPGTAAALRARGVTEVWVPSRFTSEAVGEELPAEPGARVLRIRAEAASPAPAAGLRARGVQVEEVVAYRTIEAPPASRQRLRAALELGVDGLLFTSASTVRGLLRLADETGLRGALERLPMLAIGPVTAAALEGAGLRADIVAPVHSVDGIITVLRKRGSYHADVGSA